MRRLRCFRRSACGAALALTVGAAPALAQDSFVRVAELGTGRPVISVLGTGMGLPYASLSLEMRCPTPSAWIMDVTGIQAEPGTGIVFGFGDPRGGFAEVQAAPMQYDNDRVRVSIDRNAFRAALAQARSEHPGAMGSDARVVVGGAVGVSVRRDALVREMTAFALDCDAARQPATARPRVSQNGR